MARLMAVWPELHRDAVQASPFSMMLVSSFQRDGLEEELVGGIVIRGYCLRDYC